MDDEIAPDLVVVLHGPSAWGNAIVAVP